jgi:hypothetical protein
MIFPSNKIRVEIVLPLYYNDKTQIEPGIRGDCFPR